MRTLVRTLLLTLVLLAGPDAPPASAEGTDDRTVALHKLNLAGRQRMLSQRIALKVCLIRTGIDDPALKQEAEAAIALFDKTLNALHYGDPALNIPKSERDPEVLKVLEDVETAWPTFRTMARKALAVDAPPDATLLEIEKIANRVLALSNIAVVVMERRFGEGLIAPERAAALNIAGRQRMLIQRAMMEVCYINLFPEEDERLRGRVANTRQIFESSLAWLLIGNESRNVISPPSSEIDDGLTGIIPVWQWLSTPIAAAASGQPIPVEELALDARAADHVLRSMNRVVGLYENY